MQTYFLALQSTYTHLEIALMQADRCLALDSCTKQTASKMVITHLHQLLESADLTFNDLAFFAANRGPGPFTTLRTTLATINGLGLATGLPLVGVDGMRASLEEYANPEHPVSAFLLNAFGSDLYFGIKHHEKIETGYLPAKELFKRLARLPEKTMYLCGGAVEQYRSEIIDHLAERAVIPDPLPPICSIAHIARTAYAMWKKSGGIAPPLLPLYLKESSPP